jgi:hypothetical protein
MNSKQQQADATRRNIAGIFAIVLGWRLEFLLSELKSGCLLE